MTIIGRETSGTAFLRFAIILIATRKYTGALRMYAGTSRRAAMMDAGYIFAASI
jgi:hypothetical protein